MQPQPSFNPEMFKSFKSYDIRGTYPDQIDETFYYYLGNAFARYLKNQGTIIVGHDARLSSSALAKAYIEGVTDGGVHVIFLGQVSTEMAYFAGKEFNPDGLTMITASHNPKEYNGAKFTIKDMVPLHGKFGLPEIKAYMQEPLTIVEAKGSVENRDIMESWLNFNLSFVNAQSWRPLTVVVDSGNGMSGPTWEALSKRLPITFYGLYTTPDGNFPNHPSDIMKPENLKDLLAKMQETKADVGFAYDGDADRLLVIDENLRTITGTELGAFLIEYFLEKHPGRTVTYNANCGKIVPEVIKAHGSEGVRTPSGHTIIKSKMREHNAVLGVEHSYHYFFEFNKYSENMTVIALLLLEELSKTGKKASELFAKYQKYFPSGEINFVVEDKEAVMQAIKETYTPTARSVDEVDGYSFWYDDYWFNVRLSNTEPLLRLNIEGDTGEVTEAKKQELIAFIEGKGGKRK